MIESISNFLERGETKYGARLALHQKIIFRLDKVSYQELFQLVQKFGTWATQNKLKAGDRVAIWAPNSPAWVVAYLGSLAHGLVVVPADIHSSSALVGRYLKETKAKFLFTSAFFTKKPQVASFPLEKLIEGLEGLPAKALPKISKTSLAEIIYTSGTTGKPKGVEITHANIVAAINALVPYLPAAEQYRVLSILPLSHIMEQIVGLLSALYHGATLYYLNNPNAVSIKKTLVKYRITHLGVVPQVLRLLWQAVELEASDKGKEFQLVVASRIASFLPPNWRRKIFSALHKALGGELAVIGVGSAPLDLKAAKNWQKVGIKVLEGYGASETTGAVSVNTLENQRLGSVGKVLPGVMVKLADSGEIQVKGEMVTSGYYLQPDLNQESFASDGWYKTGDVGRFDQEGYLYITGRERFRIVTPSGDKIYPEELERIINHQSGVVVSCVLGLPVAGGEQVVLALVLKKGVKLERVVEEIKAKLETKQHPAVVKIWPGKDFPRTHTLKIDREKVRDWFAQTKTSDLKSEEVREDKLIEILSRVAGYSLKRIDEKQSLQQTLQLDSLKRATLAAFLEAEFGIEIADLDLSAPEMTLAKLRIMLTNGHQTTEVAFPDWPRAGWVIGLREWLRQNTVFPLVDQFATKINIVGKENLGNIPQPAILISNHVGNFDLTLILRILPPKLRRKQFTVADAWHFQSHWRTQLMYWLGHAYPMVKDGSHSRQELDFITELIDQGWNLLITPEGEYEKGKQLAQFRLGSALLAVETGVPVVPFKIENFDRIYKSVKTFPYWPDGKGEVTVKVGKPLIFKHSQSYETVAEKMKEAIENL